MDELEASCHRARGDKITSSIVIEQSKPHAKAKQHNSNYEYSSQSSQPIWNVRCLVVEIPD
jgi:hypothetical protein